MPLTETVQAIGKLFKRSCSDNMNESAPLRTSPSLGSGSNRRYGYLASFPPKTGDRAGLLLRDVATSPVVVELNHYSRQRQPRQARKLLSVV
jgi:hypothetical protein